MSKRARPSIAESTDSTCGECDTGLLDNPEEICSFKVGDLVDDYQIASVLGVGGMGEVYKVRNLISDRMEAMKVLLPNLETDSRSIERFFREIKVQAALAHPNIATLHTARRVKNQILMIMECVEGMTIEKLLERGPIPMANGVDYVCQVLDALSYAHSLGIIHRDVKLSNMIVTPDGTVKLMDFGLARPAAERHLTQTGMIVGSLHYMSPEQIQGVRNLDARSDLYSVGIVLYEIATGRRPFQGEEACSIIAAHLQQNPVPPIEINPKIPVDLSNIIQMSIAKNPTDRFQSADAFRSALKGLALLATSTSLFSPMGSTASAPEPQAAAPNRHRTSTTGRIAGQRRRVVKSGTSSGSRARRSDGRSNATGKALQPLSRSLFIAISAVVGLVVLALAVAVGQKLHRGRAHFVAEAPLPVKIQTLTTSVSAVKSQPDQPEELIPPAHADADEQSAVSAAKTVSLTTATKLRQRETPSHSSQPGAAVVGTISSKSVDELKRFVSPPDLAEPLAFQTFEPPNISSTASVTDVNLNLGLLKAPSSPPTAKARHIHFLGRSTAGLLTIFGQRYRFQEDHSSHVFEGSTDDLMSDCKPANALCQIRITTPGHKEVIRLKTSDWMALQMNFGHP